MQIYTESGLFVTVQTDLNLEVFLSDFQRKNPSAAARGARKAYWNRRAQPLHVHALERA